MRALIAILFLIGCAAASPAPADAPATPASQAQAPFTIPAAPAAHSTADWPRPSLTPISATPAPSAIARNLRRRFRAGRRRALPHHSWRDHPR